MTWPLKRGVLDEAGDVGCAEGSSCYLVVAIVLIGNLHWLRKVVLKARKRLGKRLKNIPELKAWHTPRRVVAHLLNDLAVLDVEIVTVILDKQKARRPDNLEDWYRQVCGRAVQHCLERYPRFSLIVDKRYTNQCLRDRLVETLLLESAPNLPGNVVCEYAASEQEKAIQVADAVAWAVFQKYEHGDESFYQIIRDRVIVEEVLER